MAYFERSIDGVYSFISVLGFCFFRIVLERPAFSDRLPNEISFPHAQYVVGPETKSDRR